MISNLIIYEKTFDMLKLTFKMWYPTMHLGLMRTWWIME